MNKFQQIIIFLIGLFLMFMFSQLIPTNTSTESIIFVKNNHNFIKNNNKIKNNEDLFEVLKCILIECTEEQLLVNKTVLLQTITFMLQETDELDPKLIEFVRSIIHKPSKEKKLNLKRKDTTDFSQVGQSKFIDQTLNSKRNGFFVEAGGFDGEGFSVLFLFIFIFLYVYHLFSIR